MKENRRSFLKKSAGLTATLAVSGGIFTSFGKDAKVASTNRKLNGMAKDAGIKFSNAYFGGLKNAKNQYLIKLARQMDVLGAVAGLDPGEAGMPNANPWDYEVIAGVKQAYKDVGLDYHVVEGPPSLYSKTKLGLKGRDEEIANFIIFMKNLKRAGIDVICYNWMPEISWARTNVERPGRGGALVTAFDYDEIEHKPLTEYGDIPAERLWGTLEYFLKAVVPEAEKIGMKLALHPDDPQVPKIQGIPRIMNTVDNFDKMLKIVPSDYNGVTMCQGNFSLMGADVPTLIRRWGNEGKIHFVHFRNVEELSGVLPSTKFTETFHDEGDIDMYQAMKAYYDVGFKGSMRPDHVPTMAGEENTSPGYMALGNLWALGYMRGLAESVSKEAK
ncbi:mannonate dehydratase [Zunongwangia sp. F260]|uniref:mannonate dehydratase n=1 Tax=Autumnicola lenta TaxID=3075593 RepID=A0ABU3CG92_9FLAO|nr:mannonate dehydratase [Zunongwangia sp. F260]MDT0645367.1 mannonate dehydratase [Zunongwangia sp. F260]